jgi:hypothetical protein
LVEFAVTLPFFLVLIMAVIDFGHLIQTRLIMTNVAREGGSIGSRQDPLDAGMPAMMVASGRPLDFAGADGKVIVTRIEAGRSAQAPSPTITQQFTAGGLGVRSGMNPNLPTLGLTQRLHDRLEFNAVNGTADIAEVTVVETFFKYRPITPLSRVMMPGMLTPDGDGMILRSRAVF